MQIAPSTAAEVQPSLETALRRIELFRDLTDEEIRWFTEHSCDQTFEAGTVLIREGDEADSMTIIIEGQLRFQSSRPGSPVLIARPGTATGLLPFSRLVRYSGTVHAITRIRIARLHRDLFPDLMRHIPRLVPRLVAVMSDRIRENTRAMEQREKLQALSKLAAGLAHELNNPASAAQRSAEDLRYWVQLLRDSNQALAERGFDADQFQCLLESERKMIGRLPAGAKFDALERSDREELLARWLRSRNVERAYEYAAMFVETETEIDELTAITSCFSQSAFEPAIARMASTIAVERLSRGIRSSTQKITDLIRSVKDYVFVDQAPEQEIDLVAGIENTLSVLNHRLRSGITIVRDYDPTIPRFMAHGSALNQVWTQLIDNALDAMGSRGTLRVRTVHESGMALVEITDSGPGIPDEIKDRIFDPFFSTKDVGAGRGLGLDMAYRIVQHHRGDLAFASRPGETTFQVRLPIHAMDAF